MLKLIVLGMHRSGTSAIARQLHRAGLYVGQAAELLAPQADNPGGFWERRDVLDLNDEILAEAGGSWYSPPASCPAATGSQREKIAAILASLDASSPWVIKDPRLILTWGAWAPLARGTRQLLVFREPLAVAQSLQRRHGFPLALGLDLWEWYNRRALSLLDPDAFIVSYDWLVEAPEVRVEQFLDELQQRAGMEQLDTRCASLLTERPPRRESHESGCLLSESQRALHAALQSAAAGHAAASLPAVDEPLLLARIHDLAAALAPLATARESELALQSLQRERLRLERDLKACQVVNHRLQEESAELRKEGERHAAKGEELEQKLEHSYHRVLSHEASIMGRLNQWQRRLHRGMLRRGRPPGAYDDLLLDARSYFQHHQLPVPQRIPGKLCQLAAVIRYLVRHPVSSIRGFSWHRLKRALEVLFRTSPADFSVWVRSRFPEDVAPGGRALSVTLEPDLDQLCLQLPEAKSPQVSIILPVFNNYRMTIHCLKSLVEHTRDVAYEVILADDASSDLTTSIAQRVSNLRVARQEQNLGFLNNCNAAAELARGEYLLLLNNDTALGEDWLSPLVALLENRPDVGATGPRLLFPDGKLQEAGGIIWRDGSGWNYGRGDDPQKPEYEYVKDVDYISGACLLVRRSLWKALGGFDTRYAPAYYEDTDLCFALRSLGYRVCLQPHSVVFHFEGVSNGTDQNAGIKRYQKQNRLKFVEKWKDVLDTFHFPNAEHVFLARDRSRERNCILVIDHYVPHFDKDAGSRSTLMYMKLMRDLGFKVVFLGANFFPHQPYTRVLQDLGIEVLVGEHIARHLDRWLQENARYIHRVYLHRPHVAEQLLPHLQKMQPRPPIVFFGHDLHYLRALREESLLGASTGEAARWKQRELDVLRQVDTIYYPSPVEVEALQNECPELKVRDIPLYVFDQVRIPAYKPRSPRSILFVAGFNHPPNVDGLVWFIDSVLPCLNAALPDIHVHVVGSNPTEAVIAMQSDTVTVHGYVADSALASLYREVGCAVVPLRYGAGVKGKVLEAVQHGVPLVTTSIGAEGLRNPEDVMFIADSPEQFGDSVITALSDDHAVSRRLQNYQRWLQENFGRERAEAIVLADFGPVRRDSNVLSAGGF